MNKEKYSLVPTGDSTSTLFCTEYEQAMHSDSGAYNEAIEMHLVPSRVLDCSAPEAHVLDVGFGLGYNVLALVFESMRKKPERPLRVVSLERERVLAPFMRQIFFNDSRDRYYEIIRKAYETGGYESEAFSLEFLFGDARETLAGIADDRFDAVFHDPFSPSKNPELWTVEYFGLVIRKMKRGGRLTTYSSAMHVRKAMLCAGFAVGKGPGVGRKKEGTVAQKGPMNDSFAEEYCGFLAGQIKSTPYRDPKLDGGRDDILARRIAEMKKIRGQSMSSSS